MRGAPPNHGVTQGALGTVVGELKTWDGDEAPQVGIRRQKQTAGCRSKRRRDSQSQREPVPDLSLDGRKLGQEVEVRQSAIAHACPSPQQVFGLEFQVLAHRIGIAAAVEDLLKIAQQMSPAVLAIFQPGVGTAPVSTGDALVMDAR